LVSRLRVRMTTMPARGPISAAVGGTRRARRPRITPTPVTTTASGATTTKTIDRSRTASSRTTPMACSSTVLPKSTTPARMKRKPAARVAR